LNWIGLYWTLWIGFNSIAGLDWIAGWLDWIGLDFIGLDWIGLDWIGLDWIGLDLVKRQRSLVYKKLTFEKKSFLEEEQKIIFFTSVEIFILGKCYKTFFVQICIILANIYILV
jgi:hypothetical protein